MREQQNIKKCNKLKKEYASFIGNIDILISKLETFKKYAVSDAKHIESQCELYTHMNTLCFLESLNETYSGKLNESKDNLNTLLKCSTE